MKRYRVTVRYVFGPPPKSSHWTTEVLAFDSYDAALMTRHTGYELWSVKEISL